MFKLYLDNCCYNRPFDYTKWRELYLDEGLDIRELSRKAQEYSKLSSK